jgi:hypothetical protein
MVNGKGRLTRQKPGSLADQLGVNGLTDNCGDDRESSMMHMEAYYQDLERR